MSTANPIREDIALALGSEYDIVRELGRGGASVVYLARDRVLGREVAIKVIRDTHSGDTEAVARFEREARMLASLQHPNIVMLYGAKPLPGGSLALIMQHAEWSTLKAVIREQGPLPISAVEQVLYDLAGALAYLHRHQVVHRDIKPENIFVEAETGKALLSDFGIAKSADALTSVTLTGVVIGTPAYMSPEQIDGGSLTGRSDIYSLGMVGYEMLTGVRPWEGESLFGVIYKQKTETLPSLADVRPDIPDHLRKLIEKAVQKAPERRWGTAEELIEALSSPEPTALVPATWAEPVVPAAPEPVSPSDYPTLEIGQSLVDEVFAARERARRRRQRWTAAAIIALVLSGGLGALAFAGRDPSPTAAFAARADDLSLDESGGPVDGYVSAMNLSAVDTTVPDSVLPDDSVTIPAAPPAQTATTRASASTQAATPRATTPRQTAATPAATVDSMEPYYVDELPQGPPSLLPQLQMARRNTGAPSAEPLRALEDRSAGSVAPPRLSNREAVGTLLSERYPGDLRARGVGGTTIVTVLVAPDGTVRDSRLYTSSGNGRLDQVALGVTGRMRFSHPSSNATPEMVWVAVPLTFTPP